MMSSNALYRDFKPDVIIIALGTNDFSTVLQDHEIAKYPTFDKVGDESVFSEQLKHTNVWQPKRLFFNTSSWFYSDKKQFENASKDFTKFDVGVFYPLKGCLPSYHPHLNLNKSLFFLIQ